MAERRGRRVAGLAGLDIAAIFRGGARKVEQVVHDLLVLEHGAITASAILAIGPAILVTLPFGADFLPVSRAVANIGQTFPPVAVLTLRVPLFGFGTTPTLVALFL